MNTPDKNDKIKKIKFVIISLFILSFSLSSYLIIISSASASEEEKQSKKQCTVTVEFTGGRLGNQLFEVATALSIAKDHNCKVTFPMFTEKESWSLMDTYGFAPEKLFASYIDDSKNAIFSKLRLGPDRDLGSILEIPNIVYEDIKARECYSARVGSLINSKISTSDINETQDVVIKIRGIPQKELQKEIVLKHKPAPGWGGFYFMSYKLFDHNKKYIQDTFVPSVEQKKALLEKFKKHGLILEGKKTASIHVRRGDRIQFKWKMIYPPATKSYYKEAIINLENQLKARNEKIDTYVVFSDDVEYAKSLIADMKNKISSIAKTKFFFVDFKKHDQKDYEDLWLMSMCDHNIIMNSTFSFWGGYLNQNPKKIVITPQIWFGIANVFSGFQTNNVGITPPEWTAIKQNTISTLFQTFF
ncbi:MAG: alpha-1,2-fucosyltransferase [Oligoflexia bacterium]|nr:alpha-1,2-fucosyltransferase [Oligoflexia bacterium]